RQRVAGCYRERLEFTMISRATAINLAIADQSAAVVAQYFHRRSLWDCGRYYEIPRCFFFTTANSVNRMWASSLLGRNEIILEPASESKITSFSSAAKPRPDPT